MGVGLGKEAHKVSNGGKCVGRDHNCAPAVCGWLWNLGRRHGSNRDGIEDGEELARRCCGSIQQCRVHGSAELGDGAQLSGS